MCRGDLLKSKPIGGKSVKIGFVSLGCPKNQIDTEIMLHELMNAGYEITAEDIEADIIIINTCAFIQSAKQEAIDNILDIAWLKKNRTLKGIIVTGCLAERYRDEILNEFPEVDAIVGVGSIHDITEAVESVMKNERYKSYKPVSELKLGGDRIVISPEYSVYLKVSEGCDNRCTYCAIPLIRGGMRSRPMEDIIAEARNLVSLGAKELILIAQDTTGYGSDLYGEYKLPELIREITSKTNVSWLRLMYCYPNKITDDLIAEIRDNPKVVKYIDLPIQHVTDNMLTAMNRHGGSDVVRSAVKRLRDGVPDIIIRTTAIVGFPGETDADFEELCKFVSESVFDRFGAFTYSREEDTAAYDLPGQIDEQVKQDRYDIIMQTQLTVTERLNETKIGNVYDVLCEGFDPVSESFYGRSYMDAPETDGKVYFSYENPPENYEGMFVKVKITETLDYDLIGEVIL